MPTTDDRSTRRVHADTLRATKMNVLLLLGLLITAFAVVLAMQTDEQSRSRH